MDSNVGPEWQMGPHTGKEIVERFGPEMQKEYPPFGADPVKFDQFVGAELVARKYKITKEESDAYAMRSHALLDAATKAGKFTEIVPLPCRSHEGISKAEVAPEDMHSTD